ncbi:cobalt ECF transporter T component CbiQ [Petrocella sp. FN5]|uniref:cobalt ECF transporter T component CbiQ n=1 Tax=Petrocella sp. FN5 TaxID=3032002 RepID=UPI0023DAFA6E|nr:cobalt ECF transporter T component CbiQ [Petrocella sp. FN5]MDF1617654.1 cobalt ECF transporter T component CbiQ [Petrocella sp. FN5]
MSLFLLTWSQWMNQTYIYGPLLIIISIMTFIGIYKHMKSFVHIWFLSLIFLVPSLLGVILVTRVEGQEVLMTIGQASPWLYITRESLWMGIEVMIRVMSSFSIMLFLILTTSIWEIGRFLRWVKVPKLFVEILLLTYRFLFLIYEEGMDMIMAQELRSGYYGVGNAFKSLSILLGQLFLNTIIRAQEMEEGLQMRLYEGEYLYG